MAIFFNFKHFNVAIFYSEHFYAAIFFLFGRFLGPLQAINVCIGFGVVTQIAQLVTYVLYLASGCFDTKQHFVVL